MNKKIALLTTIFPMNESYLIQFFDSLEKQTFKDFDIIVVNDGYKDFNKIKDKYATLKIIELNYSNTHAKNREYGINYVISNSYDILIFGDSDDYFKNNRVEVSIEKLKKYDIVINDLSLFYNKNYYNKMYFSNRINNNSEIKLELILDKNIFGMSNSAIKLEKVDLIEFDKSLIAIDWYLFSYLLIKGLKAVFTNETETFYRQHSDNIIGIGKLTEDKILKGIDLKIKQYKLLIKENIIYADLLKQMLELKDKIKCIKTLELINNQNIKFPLWWEEIKLIEEK
ncbi:hypothetical protein CP985_13205 [Malaciobacter mytili LMG 24559]|uniref:Glycosyltransferase 2-like domain-containing protein n=1 Tax=Malaciobacter mytili LMG 24559 TaxID=1032238 RepID=A0AAX2ADN8_9BACT|nr:glycosyltransferase [Malaciobacter mytili]AXH14489.1 glycosyltransferase, family 2 [Malaciobacter mytili LMG 24559]RXK13709.1 hypothetical protein CP985_13205 [Malaciobacter mytili LMG 24559]